ncbi:MAG: hypothetical protein NVS1B3_08720 [Candidatus Dormibacteraceae bacterium]
MNEPARYHSGPSMSRILIAAGAATFAVTTGVSAYIGYLRIFAGFLGTDDEGAMLVSLRTFVSGQALYDKIIIQYGPAYFEFFGLLGALGVPFDHNSGRIVTLVFWLGMALMAGVAVFVFTHNLALGLSTQLITFATATLASEPMHPAGLLCFLVIGVAAVALVSAGHWPGPWPFIAIGALTAAAVLIKINVGGFAAISIAFACVLAFPALARNWPVRWIASAGFIAVPFLLMRADLDQRWAQRFAIHVGLCALALVIATSTARPDPSRRLASVGWLITGGAVTALAVLAIAMFRGSSLNDLVHGIILNPLAQTHVYGAPIALPSTLVWDALAVGGALLWTVYRMFARQPQPVIEGSIRVVAGLVIWLTLLGLVPVPRLAHPLVLPFALAWVVAAPIGSRDGFATLDFARALLAALAILQSLHAFPVPGSQVAWAALPLIPVGAICIADGLSQLGLKEGRAQVATALVFISLAVTWLPPVWQKSRSAYASDVALGLPGASLVRVPSDQAAVLRDVSQSIRDNCDTFISLPGLDSFYLFAGVQPPIPFPSRWMWLAEDLPHEQALVDASKRVDRLCVVLNEELIAAWTSGRQMQGPYVSYIQDNFAPAYVFGHYVILKRR